MQNYEITDFNIMILLKYSKILFLLLLLIIGVPKSDMPTSYPTSCLLGRVNIVNVITQEEYREKVRCYKLMI